MDLAIPTILRSSCSVFQPYFDSAINIYLAIMKKLLDRYGLQAGLERAVSDVLILLDACYSARASYLVSSSKLKQGD
jgi:hypothetical protein